MSIIFICLTEKELINMCSWKATAGERAVWSGRGEPSVSVSKVQRLQMWNTITYKHSRYNTQKFNNITHLLFIYLWFFKLSIIKTRYIAMCLLNRELERMGKDAVILWVEIAPRHVIGKRGKRREYLKVTQTMGRDMKLGVQEYENRRTLPTCTWRFMLSVYCRQIVASPSL
jgi:hypothetical protein